MVCKGCIRFRSASKKRHLRDAVKFQNQLMWLLHLDNEREQLSRPAGQAFPNSQSRLNDELRSISEPESALTLPEIAALLVPSAEFHHIPLEIAPTVSPKTRNAGSRTAHKGELQGSWNK